MNDLVVIGGGAAGFFGALAYAEEFPKAKILIIEQSKHLLGKVKVSGGGRCNVTHACFEPGQLVKFYPRGSKELRSPFNRFQPQDTINWFAKRGVKIKTEADGRMFPESNNSQTIIDCFIKEANAAGIRIETGIALAGLKSTGDSWEITTSDGRKIATKSVLIASGSSSRVWDVLQGLGHSIQTPVPSLFTFNIKDERLEGIPGVSMQEVEASVRGSKLKETGPVLITHWGLSGPAILRLSAWGARVLEGLNYQFELSLNWVPGTNPEEMKNLLQKHKQDFPKRQVSSHVLYSIPTRLWYKMLIASDIDENLRWADITKKQLFQLADELTMMRFQVNGKSTFKDEFVTCGGITLSEVDMNTMQSKLLPGVYFAGEVLDIDAITGGFNFQAAWTTGWIAGKSISSLV